MARRLLLISTSTVFGTRYLEHAFAELREVLAGVRRVLFIPHALKDHAGYAAKARTAFEEIGLELDALHEAGDARRAVLEAEAVFCGGGNTFRLLDEIYRLDVAHLLRERVDQGMPYTGASAGSNLACPTIMTTNDMPIVEPPTLDALRLVAFQINPHYVDPVPGSTHMGESRETRIREYHEENDYPVVGLREGSMLRVEGASVELRGRAGARVFRRGQEPVEVSPVAPIESLVE
ncbi:MAG: dipeptidase PepE [Vicinamibacterales bacterium]